MGVSSLKKMLGAVTRSMYSAGTVSRASPVRFWGACSLRHDQRERALIDLSARKANWPRPIHRQRKMNCGAPPNLPDRAGNWALALMNP